MLPAFSVVTLPLGLTLIACLAILHALQDGSSRGLSRCALIVFIAALLYVTLLSRTPITQARWQLIPFFEFSRLKGIGFVENMILFVPAGALLLLAFPLRARHGCAFGFLLSLGVEVLQLLSRRGIADIDDLIANTLGAALGTAFCLGVQRLTRSLFLA